MSKDELDLHWQALRDFLRNAAWGLEVTRRPKDFQGLEHGLDDRSSFSKLMATPCAPALFCDGLVGRFMQLA